MAHVPSESKADIRRRSGERLGDEPSRILHPVERDEAAHAGALARAEQRFVERLEPAAQRFERVALADFEDGVLDDFAVGVGGQVRQLGIEVAQRSGFQFARRTAF